MALQALLLSNDAEVVRILRRVLGDLGMAVEACGGSEQAAESLERKRSDLAVVDMEVPGGAAVLQEMKRSSANRGTVSVAILNGQTRLPQAFQLATLTLQKPLSFERATKGFRAANVLVLGGRRRYCRHRVNMPVTITVGETHIQGTASDISEAGMAVCVGQEFPTSSPVRLQFTLPGGSTRIQADAVVAWADREGNAGFRFEQLPASAREELDRWARHEHCGDPMLAAATSPPPGS